MSPGDTICRYGLCPTAWKARSLTRGARSLIRRTRMGKYLASLSCTMIGPQLPRMASDASFDRRSSSSASSSGARELRV